MVCVGDTVTTMGVMIVTTADADVLPSALATALTVTCAGLGTAPGAVYNPPDVIVPHPAPVQPAPVTLHVTAVLGVPVTVALNSCCPPVISCAVCGETLTVITLLIITVALPCLVGSATEVAITFTKFGLGAVAGAV